MLSIMLENDIPWLPGIHQWRDDRACSICRVRREMHYACDNGPHEPPTAVMLFAPPRRNSWEFWDDDEWDAVCPPCRPRLNTIVEGLYTTKDASKQTGITPNAISTRATMRSLQPYAVLVKPYTYLWTDHQMYVLSMTDKAWDAEEKRRCAEIAARLARSGHGDSFPTRDFQVLLNEAIAANAISADSLRNIAARWSRRPT